MCKLCMYISLALSSQQFAVEGMQLQDTHVDVHVISLALPSVINDVYFLS